MVLGIRESAGTTWHCDDLVVVANVLLGRTGIATNSY